MRSEYVASFCGKLGALLGAGASLADALACFKFGPAADPVVAVAEAMAEAARQGKALSAILAEHEDRFGPTLARSVAEAERAGTVAATLAALAAEPSPEAPDPAATRDPEEHAGAAAVRALLAEAARRRASDLHLEATEDGGRVRVRVEGALVELSRLSRAALWDAVAGAKLLFGCDANEHRLPQDGRMAADLEGARHLLRLCVTPSISGESCAVRLVKLGDAAAAPDLAGVVTNGVLRERLLEVVGSPHGLVLVAGPAASGKTTTLYALLRARSRPDAKVFSIEDPVELLVPGVQQLQVDVAAGLTFAKAIRAALRSDPDVLAAGEVRDYETGEILVQAALAGMLAFSSLHASSAVGALVRLSAIGLDPILLAEALRAVLAQRLVRQLCPSCRLPDAGAEAALVALGVPSGLAGATAYRAVGCEQCSKGYRGRVAIHELLVISPRLAQVLAREQVSSELLGATASSLGLEPFVEDGARLVRAGVTSADELRRALLGTV